jgi:hypothetical protein
MPVSYLSEIQKSNPFIQSFDLGLMEKVNSYKQGMFYQNAAKVENLIGQLNTTDIANPQQKEYLTNKVNNLTSQLDSAGAVNYSDMGVTNAVESFGYDIYSDPNVINGIASTKSLRQWQGNVQKLKTDPKLSKYYNGANEAWDLEHYVKPYVTGGIDATYDGPKAPKPYMGNPFTKAMEVMKTLRPDIETRIDPVTGNQFFFSKTENKAIGSDKIAATLDGLIDGDTKQQLKIDSWYNFDYTTGNKFGKNDGLTMYTQEVDNVIKNNQAQLNHINDLLKSEPDINKKKQYELNKNELTDNINTYTARRNSMLSEFGKDWDESPENAKYKLYMKRFYNDIVKAAGYDETKIDLVKNEQRMFSARVQLEYAKNGLWWDGESYNSDGTPAIKPVTGAEHMIKSTTNEGKTPIDISAGLLHDIRPNTENTAEAEKNRVTQESLVRDNELITQQQTQKLKSVLEIIAKTGGYDLGYKDSPESNAGAKAVISTSPLIEAIQNIGDKSTLTRDDIKFVLDRVNEQNVSGRHPEGRYAIPDSHGKYIGLSKNQVQFFRNVMKNWDAVAIGQQSAADAPMNISVSDWSNFVHDNQTLELNKQSRIAYMNSVRDQAFKGIGLTPEEMDIYNNMLYFNKNTTTDQNGTLVTTNGGAPDAKVREFMTFRQDPANQRKLGTILTKLSDVNETELKKRQADLYKNASDRLNYSMLYLPDADSLEKALPGVMAKIRAHAENDKNLAPQAITKKDDGTFELTFTYDDKSNNVKTGALAISSDEAAHLGGQLYPNEPLEQLLKYQTTTDWTDKDGTTHSLYTYSDVFKQPIKYSIERLGNDRNSTRFLSYIYYLDKETGKEEKVPIYDIADKTAYQGSANAAEFLLKRYISNHAFKGITMDQFVKGARSIANQ